VKTFTYKYNPSRDFGSNREFYNDLKEALEADEVYAAKPTLLKLLAITQVVMNSWEKDAYTASRRAQGEVKRKGPVAPTNTDNAKRSRADAPRPQSISGQTKGCPRLERPRPVD
jgi:hypothetical protein